MKVCQVALFITTTQNSLISSSLNLVPKLIRLRRIQWRCSPFFCLRLEASFLGKFGLKMKIVSLNWNMVPRLIWVCRIQWLCSFFSVLDGKYTLFGQIWSKTSKLSLKFRMRNGMVLFTFSFLDQKSLFWANITQKNKIASVSWNLVPMIIRICRIQWSLLFLFYTGKRR